MINGTKQTQSNFPSSYGFVAVSINLLLCSFVAQLGMLMRGLLSEEFREKGVFTISIEESVSLSFFCVCCAHLENVTEFPQQYLNLPSRFLFLIPYSSRSRESFRLMRADLSCAPVLISMGALIGRLTPSQVGDL